jgi:hypothetical protein
MINQNPFRVLGIATTASEREIQKQVTKTTRFAEVGKQVSFDTDFPFLGELKRDKESISTASSAIEQPINRLLHSLFWFWNANHIDAAAFDNLSKDNTDKATEIWEKVVKDGDVSLKNLSCLFNLKSLYVAQSLKDNSLDSKLFITGVLLAGKFLNHSELDSYTKQIVGDHVNVSSEELEIKYITSIYSTVKPFLKKKNGITTDDFLSGFATFSKKSKEHISAKFTGDPIKKIEDQINTTSELREQNPIEALSFGETLYKNTKSQLESLSKILGQEDLKYQMLANKLANEILQCGIDFFNKVREEDKEVDEDGKKVLKLCKLAKKMVSGFESQTNARIDETKEFMDEWLKDTLRIVQEALNKAFKDYEADNLITSSSADLLRAAQTLIKKSDGVLIKMKQDLGENDEKLIDLSNQVVQMVIALAIKYSNSYHLGAKEEEAAAMDCLKLFKKTKSFLMTAETKARHSENFNIISQNALTHQHSREFPPLQYRTSNSGGCYIATMVYGDYEHPQVLVLREFRDNFLAHYVLGKSFIRFYYKYSPGWVKALEHNKMINKSIEKALNTFIKIYQ